MPGHCFHHSHSGMEVLGLQVQCSGLGWGTSQVGRAWMFSVPEIKMFLSFAPKKISIRNWEDGHKLQICEIKHPSFCFVSFFHPQQLLGVSFSLPDTRHGGKRPIFLTFYNPLPLPQKHPPLQSFCWCCHLSPWVHQILCSLGSSDPLQRTAVVPSGNLWIF